MFTKSCQFILNEQPQQQHACTCISYGHKEINYIQNYAGNTQTDKFLEKLCCISHTSE